MWESLASSHHTALHTVDFQICKDPQLLIQSCLAREATYTRLPRGWGASTTCSPPHVHPRPCSHSSHPESSYCRGPSDSSPRAARVTPSYDPTLAIPLLPGSVLPPSLSLLPPLLRSLLMPRVHSPPSHPPVSPRAQHHLKRVPLSGDEKHCRMLASCPSAPRKGLR